MPEQPSTTTVPEAESWRQLLSRLDARLDDVQQAMAEIRLIYESHGKRIERIEHELFGNGRSGLAVQVRALLWISSGIAGFVGLLGAHAIAAWVGRL